MKIILVSAPHPFLTFSKSWHIEYDDTYNKGHACIHPELNIQLHFHQFLLLFGKKVLGWLLWNLSAEFQEIVEPLWLLEMSLYESLTWAASGWGEQLAMVLLNGRAGQEVQRQEMGKKCPSARGGERGSEWWHLGGF